MKLDSRLVKSESTNRFPLSGHCVLPTFGISFRSLNWYSIVYGVDPFNVDEENQSSNGRRPIIMLRKSYIQSLDSR